MTVNAVSQALTGSGTVHSPVVPPHHSTPPAFLLPRRCGVAPLLATCRVCKCPRSLSGIFRPIGGARYHPGRRWRRMQQPGLEGCDVALAWLVAHCVAWEVDVRRGCVPTRTHTRCCRNNNKDSTWRHGPARGVTTVHLPGACVLPPPPYGARVREALLHAPPPPHGSSSSVADAACGRSIACDKPRPIVYGAPYGSSALQALRVWPSWR